MDEAILIIIVAAIVVVFWMFIKYAEPTTSLREDCTTYGLVTESQVRYDDNLGCFQKQPNDQWTRVTP